MISGDWFFGVWYGAVLLKRPFLFESSKIQSYIHHRNTIWILLCGMQKSDDTNIHNTTICIDSTRYYVLCSNSFLLNFYIMEYRWTMVPYSESVRYSFKTLFTREWNKIWSKNSDERNEWNPAVIRTRFCSCSWISSRAEGFVKCAFTQGSGSNMHY